MREGEERWLHFLPGARLAVGTGREALYKLAMKAVKRDGQGSGWPAPGLWRPWNAWGLLRSQCLFTVYLS